MSDLLEIERLAAELDSDTRVMLTMQEQIDRLTAAKEAWKGIAEAYRKDRDYALARVEALEDIVCVYADPTGAPCDEHDLIMSCHDWWRKEKAATEQGGK